CTRVRRDDLLTFQVDGTLGSAVAGLRRCYIQPRAATPKPVWNPDIPQAIDFFAGWQEIPDNEPYENAFRAQWELFLRHVAQDAPFAWDLLAGAKGVQLAELAHKSSAERRWIEGPELKAGTSDRANNYLRDKTSADPVDEIAAADAEHFHLLALVDFLADGGSGEIRLPVHHARDGVAELLRHLEHLQGVVAIAVAQLRRDRQRADKDQCGEHF